jgi:hypothetical protein
VSVAYATGDESAKAGADYTATSGTLSWADQDAAGKSFAVPISNALLFVGSRTFTVTLSAVSSGGTLGAPTVATVTISGAGVPGTLALSASTYAVAQSAGSVTVTATRSGGSSGAVSVAYATANGTGVAGTDYTSQSGTMTWADQDASSKSFTIPISKATAFNGSRTFTATLSAVTGGATLGSPGKATLTINGSLAATSPTGCAQSSSSWVSQSVGSGIFDYVAYGNYVVQADNWGNLPNQVTWANSAGCWGMTDSRTTDTGGISSYPHVTRGWMESSALGNLSTAGTYDWTTKSGMGIQVSQLTKAKMQWSFTTPTTAGIRWMALQDIYFHKTNNPAPSEFPPFIDLMIDQALADQVLNNTTYFALVATNDHASTVTLGGNTYLVTVDDPGEASFHQAGGHNIHLFNLPTSFTSNNANATWGVKSATTDVAAIIQYFMQPNPLNDAGQPLLNSSGNPITSPIIASNLYLNAINAGWEIDDGTAFSTNGFCIAMQSEPDCQ